jgi:iron uptake system component EfeO
VVRSARLARISAAVGAVALVAAACGPASPGASGGSSAAPATGAPGTVAVEAKEYTFTPSTISVPAGAVTFTVKNTGTEEHEFEIFKGEAVVDEIEGLVPGLTKNLTVTLAAGDYAFMCKLNGHDQLGMKGTLTVN